MVSPLARCWLVEHIEPAPGLTGYWHVDEAAPFNFIGLTDSAQTTRCPLWLETSAAVRLQPLIATEIAADSPRFYLEVVTITNEQVRLALWVKYSSEISFNHKLAYKLVPRPAQGASGVGP